MLLSILEYKWIPGLAVLTCVIALEKAQEWTLRLYAVTHLNRWVLNLSAVIS